METNPDEALLRLQSEGWCVVEDIIPENEVAAVRASVEATVRAHRHPRSPKHVGFLPGLINYDQSFAPYLADKRLMRLITALLGRPVRISFTTALINYSGNERGGWHADWPFNQRNAGHIPAPYPNLVMHITTLWMLTPFTDENGGTLVVPGSHHLDNNPTGDNGYDPMQPHPDEVQAVGRAGSVLVFDSRLWHAVAPSTADEGRVALAIRYAPWWLDLKVLMPGAVERARLQQVTGLNENEVAAVRPDVFETLPKNIKPLYEHWVARW